MNVLANSSLDEADLNQAIDELSRTLFHDGLRAKGTDLVMNFPPDQALNVAANLGGVNPFFLPNIPTKNREALQFSYEEYSLSLMRMRMTAQNSSGLRVLIACMPKSASTFITSRISKAFSIPQAGLFSSANNASALGGNLMSQELEEIALMQKSYLKAGYCVQQHMPICPYTAQMLDLYGVKPIVLYRNILDILVSADDMHMKDRNSSEDCTGTAFYDDGLPSNYQYLERNERLEILAHARIHWLVRFYVSWKKCEAHGWVKPLWISYEDDFLENRKMMVARIIAFLGQQDKVVPKDVLDVFLDNSEGEKTRFNTGVPGRGADVPEKVKEMAKRIAGAYGDEFDMTPIIGDL